MSNHIKTIGLIINPIAGMGGRVGLKGTDSEEILREAVERGAVRSSPDRMLDFVDALVRFDTGRGSKRFLLCRGAMGGRKLHDRLASIDNTFCEYVFSPKSSDTTADDTVNAVEAMAGRGVGLIVFAGGDGTARNVLEGLMGPRGNSTARNVGEGRELRKDNSPQMLGVPTGVKMHSSVFALSPGAAGDVVGAFLRGEATSSEREVMDIDEANYRSGILTAKLYGYARAPVLPGLVQAAKSTDVKDDSAEKEGIAEEMAYEIGKDHDTVYLLGAGTTVYAIKEKLDIDGTLLGVDAVMDGVAIGLDIWERQIMTILDRRPGKIVLAPIGRQGFLLGRGNQQFSPEVIREVGTEKIIVVSTRAKLLELDHLVIYTGDRELDEKFPDYIKVLVGLDRYRMMKVRIA